MTIESQPRGHQPRPDEPPAFGVGPLLGLAAVAAAVLWYALTPVPPAACSSTAVASQAAPASGTAPAATVAVDRDQEDPLPSWNDGPTKRAILDFVAQVTREGASTFVPVPERVAVFDHDGTLVCEKPILHGLFFIDRIHELAQRQPEIAHEEPFATLLTGDIDFVRRLGKKYFLDLMFTTLAGVSEETLEAEARQFLVTARHPAFDVPLADVTYQPMKEVIALLRRHDFAVWICSGSGVHFMRPAAEAFYGIGPDRVIASRAASELRETAAVAADDGSPNRRLELVVQPHLLVLNDEERKPVSIGEHVGRRPIFAAGNVGTTGDIEMLRWSQSSGHPTLQLLVLHDDAEREMAYGEPSNDSLEAAERYGWHVARMATDWNRVFARPLEKKAAPAGNPSAPATSGPIEGGAVAVPPSPPVADQAAPAALPAVPPPVRWEKEIAAFEESDRERPPAAGGVVFLGSSNIRMWDTLADDFPGMNAVNRGVGGSLLAELATLAHRLVPAAKPRVVVVSAGGNDIAAGSPPAAVRDAFDRLVENLRRELPDVKIMYLAMLPSEKRWEQRGLQREANEAVRDFIAAQGEDSGLAYVDTTGVFLGPDGLPAVECFLDDKLHPSTIGNARRAAIVRPLLEEMLR
jgi:lysophospholipase L1-like esterase/phosphoserine phosphatase